MAAGSHYVWCKSPSFRGLGVDKQSYYHAHHVLFRLQTRRLSDAVTPPSFHFELSWDYLVSQMSTIGPPFLLGCAICAVVSAVLGYFGIRALWRYSVVRSWQQRKLKLNPFSKN